MPELMKYPLQREKIEIIDLRDMPMPPIGGKCFLLDRKGIFIFEGGPGTLRTIACTHAGSGSLIAYDGIPDENGDFPEVSESDPGYDTRVGRPIYKANPTVMGSWMLDGGFYHGLTIKATGGHDRVLAMASVVWLPYRKR